MIQANLITSLMLFGRNESAHSGRYMH